MQKRFKENKMPGKKKMHPQGAYAICIAYYMFLFFFVRMFWCLLKSLPRADFFESSLGKVGVFVAPAETTDKKWTLPVPWC